MPHSSITKLARLVRHRRKQASDARLISLSPYFNAGWYLTQNPDVAEEGIDPALHYLEHGYREMRDPSPRFSTRGYLARYPDVAKAGVNPLLHYIRSGNVEGRLVVPFDEEGIELISSSDLFDSEWYLAQNPDVRRAGLDPLAHYVEFGAWEGRDPGPRFDSDWYLLHNPDVRATGVNPLVHYLRHGAREGRPASEDEALPSARSRYKQIWNSVSGTEQIAKVAVAGYADEIFTGKRAR